MKNENKVQSLGITDIVFIVFIIIKLAGLVNWSWLIIFSPIYIGLILKSIGTLINLIIKYNK